MCKLHVKAIKLVGFGWLNAKVLRTFAYFVFCSLCV